KRVLRAEINLDAAKIRLLALEIAFHCEPASNRDPVRFRSSSLIGVEYDCRSRVPIGADWDPSHSGVFSGYFSWLRQYWLGSRFGADSQGASRSNPAGASDRRGCSDSVGCPFTV